MNGAATGATGHWVPLVYVARHPATITRMIGRFREQSSDGSASGCNTLALADLRVLIPATKNPALVMAGRLRAVSTVEDVQWPKACIPDACILRLALTLLLLFQTAYENSESGKPNQQASGRLRPSGKSDLLHFSLRTRNFA